MSDIYGELSGPLTSVLYRTILRVPAWLIMNKRTLMQAVFFFLSIALLTGFWVNNHQSLFQTTAEKFENPWDKCERGALCRSPEDNKNRDKNKFPDKNCVHVCEGNIEELKCKSVDGKTDQWFSLGRTENCGKKEKEKPPRRKTPTPTPTPTPTVTPTPTPTPTVTPTPTPTVTPGPTPTPTLTPTPTPPQVLGAEAPKVLPKTGFPAETVFGFSVFAGSLGWFLLRRFR